VVADGHLFLNVNLGHLKLKQIIILDMLEQNIIVKNVGVIMDIYSMTVLNLLAKDIAIMEKR
jgi:DNA-binding CsgD family transcriptional regulator